MACSVNEHVPSLSLDSFCIGCTLLAGLSIWSPSCPSGTHGNPVKEVSFVNINTRWGVKISYHNIERITDNILSYLHYHLHTVHHKHQRHFLENCPSRLAESLVGKPELSLAALHHHQTEKKIYIYVCMCIYMYMYIQSIYTINRPAIYSLLVE